MAIKSNTLEFIKKAVKIHIDRFDYSKSVYVNNSTNIVIICKKHGEFLQTPANHLMGRNGCKCACIKRSENRKSDTLEFIQKAKKVHGDKYNYSQVHYVDSYTNVEVHCFKHGIKFFQRPNNHLNGRTGCPKCDKEKFRSSRAITIPEFIIQAKKTHGDKYDYSLVDYKNWVIKVKIICKKHGIFVQAPLNHKHGDGCPSCNFSRGEEKIRNYLNKNNFIYESGKKFKECKNIRLLPFDFFVPGINTVIEYDGEQHFRPINFGVLNKNAAKEKHESTKFCDAIKTDFCQKSGIRLIRIPYFQFNQIETILTRKLGEEKVPV